MSGSISLDQMKGLIGHVFPGGRFVVEPYENWLLCDILRAAQMPEADAHPLFAYICATTGIGTSLTELIALCGATADDGPMQAEVEMEFSGELKTGHAYSAKATITDVVRKQGRKTGVFDIMTYRVEILDEGEVVATSSSSIIFPRRS